MTLAKLRCFDYIERCHIIKTDAMPSLRELFPKTKTCERLWASLQNVRYNDGGRNFNHEELLDFMLGCKARSSVRKIDNLSQHVARIKSDFKICVVWTIWSVALDPQYAGVEAGVNKRAVRRTQERQINCPNHAYLKSL